MGCASSKPAAVANESSAREGMQAALAALKKLPNSDRDAETWDNGNSFHWADDKSAISECRQRAEQAAAMAVIRLDEVEAPTVTMREAQQVKRGVKVRWLKSFAKSECSSLTTAEVVLRVVKPKSRGSRCRFVELPEMRGHVGQARVFVSHTWNANFADLVAAIAHVMKDEDIVWLDIFAVRQWPGNGADLSFACIVRDTEAFLLVATHLTSIASLRGGEKAAAAGSIPDDAKRTCAFWRVWCLVELATALVEGKPVVMLVGNAQDDGGFKLNAGMLQNLYYMVDVSKASASVDADRVRILADVAAGIGVTAVNTGARGAIAGALWCMSTPSLLAAAVGDTDELDAVTDHAQQCELLLAAAAGGFCGVMSRLIGRGAPPSYAGRRGKTALLLAAAGGHTAALIELLESHGVPVDQADGAGRTAIVEASLGGHLATVRALLDRGALANGSPGCHSTPLSAAATSGHTTLVEVLLGAGASIEAPDTEGQTPLMVAAFGGQEDVVEVLLAHGASIHSTSENGRTALMQAASTGHLGISKRLLESGAKVEVADTDGKTAFYHAATSRYRASVEGGHLATLRHLGAAGAAFDLKVKGKTPLLVAAEKGKVEILDALLELGADVHTLDDNGESALLLAAPQGCVDVVQCLLARDAAVDITAADGVTPLMRAAQAGASDVCAALMSHGASKEAVNQAGENAMTMAEKRRERVANSQCLPRAPKEGFEEVKRETLVQLDQTIEALSKHNG